MQYQIHVYKKSQLLELEEISISKENFFNNFYLIVHVTCIVQNLVFLMFTDG